MLFSYIDPATGAMVIQVVAAAVLTAGVFFRRALLYPFQFLSAGGKSEPEIGKSEPEITDPSKVSESQG